MSVLPAQLDSSGTDNWWTAALAAALAAAMGGDRRIAMDVVGRARSMDGGGAITMDFGDVIGQRWHKRSMDGGVSGNNGRRQKDTTINQMHGQKAAFFVLKGHIKILIQRIKNIFFVPSPSISNIPR